MLQHDYRRDVVEYTRLLIHEIQTFINTTGLSEWSKWTTSECRENWLEGRTRPRSSNGFNSTCRRQEKQRTDIQKKKKLVEVDLGQGPHVALESTDQHCHCHSYYFLFLFFIINIIYSYCDHHGTWNHVTLYYAFFCSWTEPCIKIWFALLFVVVLFFQYIIF